MKAHRYPARLLCLLALVVSTLLLSPAAAVGAVEPSPSGGRAPAPETVIGVTTTTDELATNGFCSLREAIQAANTDLAVDACPGGGAADTIIVPAGTYLLTLTGAGENGNATGDLDVGQAGTTIAISGAGAGSTIVDGNLTDRVFDIRAGTVAVLGMTIRNGRASQGGGVYNGATLALDLVLITGNIAQGPNGANSNSSPGGGNGGLGGGIYNTAGLTISASTLAANQAIGGNGGNSSPVGWAGGGGGGAGMGGAIFNSGGSLTVAGSTLSGNTARGGNGGAGGGGGGGGGGLGAAIFNNSSSDAVNLLNCTLSGNQATGGTGGNLEGGGGSGTGANGAFGQGGAGAHIGGAGGFGGGGGGGAGMGGGGGAGGFAGGGGSMSGGGQGGSGYGGGLFNLDPAGSLAISHSTLSANAANRGAAGPWNGPGTSYGGGLYDSYTRITLKNSIVAGNTANDNHPDISGAVVSAGYNLVGNSSGGSGFVASDLLDVSPLLGALAGNGGPTQTHALGAGSPAIDAGICTDISSNPVAVDQRGGPRPLGVTCDMGAYEAQLCFATIDAGATVFPTVQAAIDASNPYGEVRLAGACAELADRLGNVQVAYLDRNLTVRGGYTPTNWAVSDPAANPTTLDAHGGGRGIYIAAGIDATVENLTVTGGNATGAQGGGIRHAGANLTLNNAIVTGNTADAGGGMEIVSGLATLANVQIVTNTAPVYGGAGIWIDTVADVTMNSGEIRGNTGMGVYVAHGHMTLAGGQIDGNTGGGVFVHNSDSSFTQLGGSIIGNTSTFGAGLYVRYGTATLSSGEIADNVATGTGTDDGGGGLYVTYGQATIGGVQIVRNTTAANGGGVYVSAGTVTLTGGQIADNTAAGLGGAIYVAGGSATGSGMQIGGNQATDGGALYQAGGGTLGLAASCIVSNTHTAAANGGGAALGATGNWWGSADGPSGAGPGSGDSAGSGVDYAGFLTGALPGCGEVLPANLTIVKTAQPLTATPGQTVTYTLEFANAGPRTAYNVVITDLLPGVLGGAQAAYSGAAITATAGVSYSWTVADLPAGSGGRITITAMVSPALGGLPAQLDNTAEIATTGSDANLGDNSSLATVALVDAAIEGLSAGNSSPTTLGQPTTFTATVSAGTNVTYAWAFGDGQYGSGATPGHTYTAAGLYTAVVTATNGAGSASTTTMANITNLAPVADAGPDQAVAVDLMVTLDGTASADPDGHLPLAYAWTQIAGLPVALSDPAAAQPVFIAAATPTSLEFSLVVTDAYGLGAAAPDTVVVTVGDAPISGLSLETSSPTPFGQPTTFTATVQTGSNVVFSWDWGDGGGAAGRGQATEATAVISHTYSVAGSYTAVVTATNGAGAESLGATVEVVAPPACLVPLTGAGLSGLPEAFVDLTWFFTATLEPAGATAPITYTWWPEPASGQGSNAAAYTWGSTGTFTLTVLAENCGGQASASLAVEVLAGISTTVEPGVTTTIVYTDPQVVTTTVIIPPGAISENITLVFSPNPTPTHPVSDGLVFAGHSFDLDAYLGQQLLPGFAFSEPISVAVHYTSADIEGIQESGLQLYFWTGSAWSDGADTCSPPSIYSRDLEMNRLAVAICHLTEWNIQGPESMRTIYLPLIVKTWSAAPDLVVERIVANSDDVQVVIRNQGNAAAAREFWVDVYVDPNPPPTHVNQTWDQLGDQGLVWGVSGGALPLEPGEMITLTIGDEFYWAEYSYVDWPLPAGAPIYAQVDSADAETTYGAILELDEIRNLPYNNILGPDGRPLWVAPTAPRGVAPIGLPPRRQAQQAREE